MPGVSFDRAAEYYDATRGYTAGTAERIRDVLITTVGASRATRFLELGVGTGRIALPFLQAGYNYTGVDISRAMLDVLRSKLTPAVNGHGPSYRLCQADITSLPFAAATFDVALGVHVLHLVDGWQRAIDETLRVLRRPSYLVLAGDEGQSEHERDPGVALAPPLQAQAMWGVILRELGYSQRVGQPGIRNNDARLAAYLHTLGACTQAITLTTYARPAISARMVLERYEARIYSSDWALPDDIHAEAVQRLKQWLETECSAPDEAVATVGQFKALLAVWE